MIEFTLFALPTEGLGLVASVFLFAFFVNVWANRKTQASLPPGPRGLPWIGVGFTAPNSMSLDKYTEWSQIYGPIYHFVSYGQSTVVLNSARVVIELLERRGASYVDRPYRPLLKYAGVSEALITGHEYTPRIQKMRRSVIDTFGKLGEAHYADVLGQESHRFLRRAHENPGQISQHILTSSAASIADMVYAYDVENSEDLTVQLLFGGLDALFRVLRTHGSVADAFPILRHLPKFIPGAQQYRDAGDTHDYIKAINTKLVSLVKTKLALGTARKSLLGRILDSPTITTGQEDMAVWASLAAFIAGFTTVASAIHTFVLAMTLHPASQACAQAELDSVIGQGRLPSLEDRLYLPYTSAVVKEVLRWVAHAPIGVAHRAKRDDIYMGYMIPKDATIISNIAAIIRDPEVYHSPEMFKPERFLGPNPEPDPANFAFGYGPRVCPGSRFAEASIFLHASAMLTVFNITPAKDARSLDPSQPHRLPRFPSPIPCSLKLRSQAAYSLIETATYRAESNIN